MIVLTKIIQLNDMTHLPRILSSLLNYTLHSLNNAYLLGLVHISQMSNTRLEKPEEVVEMGERVYCKVIAVEVNNSINFLLLLMRNELGAMKYLSNQHKRGKTESTVFSIYA